MSNLPYEGVIVLDDNNLVVRDTDKLTAGLIATFTGRVINPLYPDPAAIDIDDIAHALANSCRFTGHVRKFYSVAQHSVLCSQIVDKEFQLVALLHDASEAYLSDISRPIKSQAEFGDVYKKFELQLEAAVAEKFGLPFPWPPEVKVADNILLRTEQRDLMPPVFRHAGSDYLDMEIEPWTPEESEKAFLEAYTEYIDA